MEQSEASSDRQAGDKLQHENADNCSIHVSDIGERILRSLTGTDARHQVNKICAQILVQPAAKNKSPLKRAGFYDYAGDHLISHTISRAVPSAQRGLTSVFGMGTGVTLAVWSPAN